MYTESPFRFTDVKLLLIVVVPVPASTIPIEPFPMSKEAKLLLIVPEFPI